ncbi:hypothetical protein BD560DRAFT_424731 [Blakeslea trispora]|nr:hypothetical protein BD560DRAFT_424731 [Blakeslea trispora]
MYITQTILLFSFLFNMKATASDILTRGVQEFYRNHKLLKVKTLITKIDAKCDIIDALSNNQIQDEEEVRTWLSLYLTQLITELLIWRELYHRDSMYLNPF